MNHLDKNFIKRATRITSFNLNSSDFTSLSHKLEIQTLYQQHMFPSFEPSKALETISVREYNNLVSLLKSDDAQQYEKLHNLSISGVGPGEAVMYLLTKNGKLGGGSSAGVDIINGSSQYEVKAAKWKSKQTKDSVSDFKLGGGLVGMTQIESDIQNLAFELGLKPKGSAEISGKVFGEMKKLNPNKYNEIEGRYQKLAGTYFRNHDTIFLQTEKNQPDFGEILAIKKVNPSDISMERFTSKTIKPIVRIR